MRNICIVVLSLVTSLLLGGCKKDVTEVSEPAKLAISGKSSFSVPACGQIVTVTVNSNAEYDWEIVYEDGGESWISETVSRAVVSNVHTFEVAENRDKNARTASILFTSVGGDVQRKVKIVQSGRDAVLRIYHSGRMFALPTLSGTDIAGNVDWGDGSGLSELEEGASHYYDTDDEHCVTIGLSSVESVKLENIEGVTLIDLSEL